jgi:hypothetical protein
MELIDVGFSFEDPPYKVREALLELLAETDGVLKKPQPIVATLSYSDISIKYRLIYRTMEKDRWPVKNEVVSRIWYVAKRYGFTMPYPVQVELAHQQERPLGTATRRRRSAVGIPASARDTSRGECRTRQLVFGAGERLYDEGDDLDGVYFVVSGTVSLQMVIDGQAERDRYH